MNVPFSCEPMPVEPSLCDDALFAELGRMALAEYQDVAAVTDSTDARHDMIKLVIKKKRRWPRANRTTLSQSA